MMYLSWKIAAMENSQRPGNKVAFAKMALGSDNIHNLPIANRYGVEGYPGLVFFS